MLSSVARASARSFRFAATAAVAALCAQSVTATTPAEEPAQDLPTVSLETLRSNNGKDGRPVWVCFKRGVYDVTEFAASHPGGSKILLAAGGSVAPFWRIYAVHGSEFVQEVLASLRVGNLSEEDADEAAGSGAGAEAADGPFANEPARLPGLVVRSSTPFNAESPPDVLGDAFYTPSELFYVRNHLAVPQPVADDAWRVDIASSKSADAASPTLSLSPQDLATRFRQHRVVSVLQCGGNRRSAMNAVKGVHGLKWGVGAIGNASWEGPLLRDVLLAAGVSEAEAAAAEAEGRELHVVFEGADTDEEGKSYGASLPLWRALSADHEMILALRMNGEPLSRDHGAPVRLVAPGVVAARSVKWLRSVRVSSEPSDSFWQRNDYKAFGPATDWNKMDYDAAHTIEDMPVQSAILQPLPNDEDEAVVLERIEDDGEETVEVQGYAWGGGGRGIARVDVSGDGGRTWVEAELLPVPQDGRQRQGKRWAWRLWQAEVPVPADGGELVSRAVDDSCNVQPEHIDAQWSPRGLLANSWCRVKVDRR